MTPQEKALLDTIAHCEGTSTSPATKNDGYDVIVTGIDGKPEIFTSYDDHPFAIREPKLIRSDPPLHSTAAGRYQVLYRFWRIYEAKLGLTDFSPASQDAVALRQAKECGALAHLEQNNLAQAITSAGRIWASLPGSPYGQPTHTMEAAMALFHGSLAEQGGTHETDVA
jgi:muramidase (phage lysozyme)